MPSRHPSLSRLAIAAVLVGLVAGACNPNASPTRLAPSGPGSSPAPSVATKLNVGLGYIPSVQFAAFYRADQAGYYAAEGLAITFQNAIDADLVPKVGAGTLDLGLSDGTSVIPAVSQGGIPIRYVATVYAKFPSIVFAKASSGITDANGLVGKKLGIPGKYGSSWIMLQALLASKNHSTSDLTIVEYPDFGQGAAVTKGAVDAATGFDNNEPVQLALTGEKVNILRVDDVTPLPGPGIIVGTATLTAKKAAVAGFVRATLKAMNEIAATPSIGVDAAIKAVPDLATNRPLQEAILAATIADWRPSGAAAGSPISGAVDTAAWQKTIAFMTTLGLVPKPVTIADLVDTSVAPGP
ncbi:MAG: putative riboflavin transport system substrate-binding protein [Chloroflexota bacterium]|nr:putative riboflavin transport system substrate-binding protein [Chloroflexota bacterium]